jgi:hypothetical protein
MESANEGFDARFIGSIKQSLFASMNGFLDKALSGVIEAFINDLTRKCRCMRKRRISHFYFDGPFSSPSL